MAACLRVPVQRSISTLAEQGPQRSILQPGTANANPATSGLDKQDEASIGCTDLQGAGHYGTSHEERLLIRRKSAVVGHLTRSCRHMHHISRDVNGTMGRWSV